MIKRVFVAGFLALASSISCAQFTTHDSKFGEDSLITDTTTGLTWLSLAPTLNMKYEDVVAQTGFGGTFAGFDVASFDQMHTMFKDVGVDFALDQGNTSVARVPADVPPGYYTPTVCPECVDSALRIGTLLSGGVSPAGGPLEDGRYLAWGQSYGTPISEEHDSSLRTFMGIAGGYDGFSFEDDGVFTYREGYAGALPYVGTWLVTTLPPVPPIPEPSTYALMFCSLAFVVYSARKRRIDS